MDSIDGVFEAGYAPPPADMPSAERQVVKKEGVRWEHSFYSAGFCYFRIEIIGKSVSIAVVGKPNWIITDEFLLIA